MLNNYDYNGESYEKCSIDHNYHIMHRNFGMPQERAPMYQQMPTRHEHMPTRHQQMPMYQHMPTRHQQMPMYQQIPMYQQMPPTYQHQQNQVYAFGKSDIEFIENNNIPLNTAKLLQKMDSVDILDCIRHRKIQEDLLKQYGHMSDQIAWNKNCEVIHEYDDGEYNI